MNYIVTVFKTNNTTQNYNFTDLDHAYEWLDKLVKDRFVRKAELTVLLHTRYAVK